MEFTELGREHLCLIRPYLEKADSHFCDLTLGNVFMWRKELDTYFAISNETLIVRKETAKNVYSYLFPIGKDVDGALKQMEEYALIHHERLCFYALDEKEVAFLSARYKYHQSTSLRSWSDYLYNLSDLRDYPGKAYSSKRHNANRFHRDNPDVTFKVAVDDDLPRLESFLDEYEKENADRDISHEEIELSREMIRHPKCIESTIGYYEKNGKIIAFSLGEKKGDCVYMHIEKALRQYEGIYQAITSDYLKNLGGDAIYANREEDDGNAGLREAKLQLRPLSLLQKFYFEAVNPIDLLPSELSFASERCLIRPLEKSYEDQYFRLATDEANNIYWGYHYQDDLKNGEVPTKEYFYDGVEDDSKNKEFISLEILLKNGEFIGELVLYHFTPFGSLELGIRLFKEYQGHGYAKEVLSSAILYLKKLGFSYLEYECYKSNVSSRALAESLMFSLKREDEERRYYVYEF
ncbi:MAG: GNAT family N-acetyltransferase [Bacilli bacterium]|jgi:RimJ/RimL family protein N-acetyltransferase|nr:GNAT family N-acetyltransferase [Bacilli bacterium]MCH4210235.1 GNAT family N-acetyltransferase [Bacilli bacterium]MCH4228417.1 GNAT family N-acetyltransferase [Bacilli bacterium]MCH4278031.1 GNAT family N-acetyltransferase [Bacilli bacterium]MCI2055159.1 GNAT family N-acetyltransferase [Bacilli bacterium]